MFCIEQYLLSKSILELITVQLLTKIYLKQLWNEQDGKIKSIKVACRDQIWKKTFCQNSDKLCCSFIKNCIMFMYLLYTYKKLIILSLFKIDTLNFTIYILANLTCPLKTYVRFSNQPNTYIWRIIYIPMICDARRQAIWDSAHAWEVHCWKQHEVSHLIILPITYCIF